MNNNDADQATQNSHLFILRMWPEDIGDRQTNWRGKVQHVNSGEARYFRDWASLEIFVDGLLHASDLQGLKGDEIESSK